ncbi:MAG: glutathione S-transferase [Bdellovibrionaceae bacterium]|nr:glutathione S-transferase [Pseudobdellovibrionaceae bacterium]
MYRIYGSTRSPFARIPRLFMIQHGIPFHFEVIDFLDSREEAARLASLTPINKVPFLEDGAQIYYDSRVIMNHLMKKHEIPALSADDENRVTAIYSLMDSLVHLFLMRRNGFDVDSPNVFIDRLKARVPAALEFTRAWSASLDPDRAEDWNYASMSLYAALFWADARGLLKLADEPAHAAFLERFAKRPGITETGF